jgi:lysophospholipase L1-like esterase
MFMSKYRLEIRIILFALLLSVLAIAYEYLTVNDWKQLLSSDEQIRTAGQNETVNKEAAETAVTENGASEPAATEPETTEPETIEPEAVNNKIVALGDSFTYVHPLGPDYSWTKRLESLLNVPVINQGKVGQTTATLLWRFESDVVAEKPAKVIIFAGTGDALQSVSLPTFGANIELLVTEARNNNITPVLALPLYYPSVHSKIQSMREWEQSYAQSEGITVLDFGSVLYDGNGNYLPGLSTDGKNPSAKGYEVMGDYAASVLK